MTQTESEIAVTDVPVETAEVSRRRRDTQSRLLDAATEVFVEFGFQGTSVERICSRADFTRGAFYSNFSSKEELFLALLRREFDERASRILSRVGELTEHLQTTEDGLSIEAAAAYVSDFLSPTGTETDWYALETEFLLLTLRDPAGPVQFVEFGELFRSELARVVGNIVQAAGRRFTIPVESAITVFEGLHDLALRTSALRGIDAPGGLTELGGRIVELLFAITEEV
ncbi:TetR/AcrR family transcriptional regulator [Leucobacter denitrificans]|uniref:TetR/AcrR family transcriptional regulator n=1 Tax=Leucobacter denitrificans TaxID=683042 RepID=UPI001FE3CC22|nr:TetR/AcrR family transcriptional regulator [Leucobacter denitrificans]